MDDNFATELQALLDKYGYSKGYPQSIVSQAAPQDPSQTAASVISQEQSGDSQPSPSVTPTPAPPAASAPQAQTVASQPSAPAQPAPKAIGSTDLSLQQQVFDIVSKGLEYVSTKPPQSIDPIQEFLDRPDGPLSRYGVTTKGGNNNG